MNDHQPKPLALRVGRPGAEVLVACDESTTDLVVAWSRGLTPGRARVVRELAERSHIPVLLVPAVVEEPVRASQSDNGVGKQT